MKIFISITLIVLSIGLEFFIQNVLVTESKIFIINNKSQFNGQIKEIGAIRAEAVIKLPLPFFDRFIRIKTNNCLNKLWINKFEYAGAGLPSCDQKRFQSFDLPPKVLEKDSWVQIISLRMITENKDEKGFVYADLYPSKKIESLFRILQMILGLSGLILIANKLYKTKM